MIKHEDKGTSIPRGLSCLTGSAHFSSVRRVTPGKEHVAVQ